MYTLADPLNVRSVLKNATVHSSVMAQTTGKNIVVTET